MFRDLSRRIEAGMPTFPGDPAVELEPAATLPADGYRIHELRCGSHAGTHVDAPSHTEPDGAVLGDRPIGEFVLDARLVDAPRGAREPIPAAALPDAGTLRTADIAVVRTGWADRWREERYADHPYLAPAAADRLAAAGCGVGVDALNPDPTPTARAGPDEPDGFPVHRRLLGDGLPIVENLRGLDGLPDRFTLYAFPLPLADCDGAPVRAVARWAEPLGGAN
jgi:kynurenine formamidase